MVAIGDEFAGDGADRVLDLARPQVALYVGGMGARDQNFYNSICQKYGYVDEAIEIQDLYLVGQEGGSGGRGAGRDCWSTPTSSARRVSSKSGSPPTRRPGSPSSR